MPLTLQTIIFRDAIYSPNSLWTLFNSFKKFEIEMDSLGNMLY